MIHNSSTAAASYQAYTAYGLTILSAIPLSEFPPSTRECGDALVRIGEGAGWIDEVRQKQEHLAITEVEARFWFKGIAAFSVKNGHEITVYPEPGTDLSLLRLYVQGMMMAMALYQRGYCVLHASVVDLGGYAIAFLGHVGAGKSSLAGAFYARGYRVLADDNAAVDFASGVPMVAPAYPCLKLFPAIASALGFAKGNLGILHVSQEKLRGSTHSLFDSTPAALKRLYVLGRDQSPEIARLSPLNLIPELIRNSAPTRWGHAGDSRQLRQCGLLATKTEAFALRTFTEAGSVLKLADRVIEHCSQPPAHPTLLPTSPLQPA